MIRAALILLCLALPAGAETRVPQSGAEIAMGFVPVVKQAAPAVVNIYASRVVNERRSPFADDPFFRDFFRDFGDTRPRVQNSLGSGVIVDGAGLVVSNYHVVGQATDIRVVLNDQREYRAELVLADEESDLAVLRIDGGDLPALDLRDSDTVEVGELVLAIGNPFGVGQTVTSGIVSGLARTGTATGNARGYFLQTDAPINPGNSGGALVDVNGDLLGINTSILSRSGGSNGIGFAIPASLVAEFLRQAEAGRDRFERPWAGMAGQSVDADLAEGLGLARPGGIVISDLTATSPFRAAGFEPGDVIAAVDGQPVNTAPEMIYRMTVAGLGATATVTRVRDGDATDIAVELIAPPNEPAPRFTVLGESEVLVGLTVAKVNPRLIVDLGLPLMEGGVVVTDPGPYGPRVGLSRGDVILAIDGVEITEPSQVGPAIQAAGRNVRLEVQRGVRRVSLAFRV
ncbi:trypsin-like peptidase domain-containing protein [Mesobacterium pallidum]|uniref:trypsin-like peptidase domain-containing protein n=1 Tax=Mesobacterium pallidum TaxID=2872037 RepID=UPI001EE1EA8D|nr:trypsin-like peptidase domain-containing protein [Mesobacterium pallidum]